MAEVATFLPLDPDLLVRASLSCPRCLHDVEWEMHGGTEEATASCECPSCGTSRDVALTPEQALRLGIGGDLDDEGPPAPGVWAL
jgi:endogenous inhibitor of DNA gyrase (YacG/DUF329 family)